MASLMMAVTYGSHAGPGCRLSGKHAVLAEAPSGPRCGSVARSAMLSAPQSWPSARMIASSASLPASPAVPAFECELISVASTTLDPSAFAFCTMHFSPLAMVRVGWFDERMSLTPPQITVMVGADAGEISGA